MKTIKKPVSILLAVLMVFSVFAVVPFTASAAENGLYVNNVYANTTTSGTGWSFNTQTNTLTLENYNFSGVGSAPPGDSTVIMFYPQDKPLTIELKGTNTIVQGNGDTNRTWWGIYSKSNLVITGDGTLNVSTNDGGYRGAAIYGEKNITITGNCTVNAKCGTVTTGPQNNGICHGDNTTLTIGENANVTITGQNGESPLVASVTNGETTMRYITFDEALNAWTDGSKLTLLADVTMNSTNTVSGTRTLDLNGYGITKSNQGRLFNVDGNLTINDSNPTRSTHKYTVDGTGLAVLDENGTQSFQGGYITGGHGYTASGEYGWGGFAIVDLGHKNQNYSLTINGGTIIGNKTDLGGGGVVRVNSNGIFTMNGGAIIYNTTATDPVSENNDGAVSGEPNVKFYIRGGTIAHNTTKGGVTSDLYLANNQKVIVDGELDSATSIGIKMQNGTGVFTDSTDPALNDGDKFFSDDSAYGVLKNNDGQLELKNVYTVTWKNWDGTVLETDKNVVAGTTPTYNGATPTRADDATNTYTFSGWTPALAPATENTTYTAQFDATAKPHEHDDVAFQPWTSNNSLPATAGNYYLTSDVTISATWEIPTGTTNLCLNGHSITKTGNGDAIGMDEGRNLNLYDCGTQTRYYTINASTHRGTIVDEAAYNAFGGTKGTFTGGYITSTQRGFTSPTTENLNSTVNMYGGTVFGCSSNFGSAVYSFGKFNIYGGAFIGNYSSHHENWSGTVYNAGQLKMSDGLIRHNYAYNGAGIFQEIWEGSSLTITGGQIIDNTASNQGGGVFSYDQNSDSAKIYISGNPMITGNKKETADNNFFIPQNRGRLIINNNLTDDAKIGITMQNGTGVFTDSTDTSFNDASKFSSDNSNYNVRKNPSGQLEIGKGYTVTWKNWDGKVLETDENVSAGTTPTYNGATPTRPSDSTNNYYFSGWEPTVDAITGDTTYTATYSFQKQIVINKGTYIRMGAYKDNYVDWFCAVKNSTGTLKAVWKQNQAAPTNLKVTEASSDVSNDGKIDGVNDTMEYSLDNGETWIPVPTGETEISGLAPGTVQIRYKAAGDKNPSPATVIEVEVKAKLFVGHSISLDGDITLNFFIDPKAIGADDFSGYSKAIVTFTWDEGQGQQYGTKSVNLLDPEETNVSVDTNGRYKVSCNVAAAHMGYEVFAELYLNGAEEPIETDAYSVREYAEEIFDNPTAYVENGDPVKAKKLKNLVKAMLNYGATAQLAFIDDLADDSVELANSYVGENGYENVTSDNITAAIKPGASDMDAVATQLTAKYYTTSLLYLSENKLRVYFTPTTYPGQIPNSGGFTGNKAGYYYYKESAPIAAADLDEQQDLSVNGVPISLSALDYAKVIVENKNKQMNKEQINLAKALFLYNQAANAYFD